MRRFLALLALLAAAALIAGMIVGASSAEGFSNGRATTSELAPVWLPGSVAYESKGAAAAFNTARLCSTRDGVDLYPSGPRGAYRKYADQVYFWNLYLSGRGNLAARPGTSNHGLGRAMDLSLQRMRAWVNGHGARFGIRKTEAFSEWWHVNYVGGFSRPNPGLSLRYPNLKRGSGGACQSGAVKEVQRRLGLKQDGRFGLGTHRAVVRFQRRHRLKADGKVGSNTWLKLRAASRTGSKPNTIRPGALFVGYDVRAVQSLLNARRGEIGQKPIAADGVYGPQTIAAVKAFQKARGLPITGKVDERTYTSLRIPAHRTLVTAPHPEVVKLVSPQGARTPGVSIAGIVFHTTESGDTKGFGDLIGVANYWNRTRSGSAHIICDAEGNDLRAVNDARRAWTVNRANNFTLNVEAIGYARFSRAKWLTRKRQLDCIAGWVAYWSQHYRVPIRQGAVVTTARDARGLPTACKATRRGTFGHSQLRACRNDHTDPGPGFPRDYVEKRALSLVGSSG